MTGFDANAEANRINSLRRERSAAFWGRRDAIVGWPDDTQGYTFLARAIDATGRAIFKSEWSGEEPWYWMTPILNGKRPYISPGYDEEFAAHILKKHRPNIPTDTLQKRLTRDQWKAAEEVFASNYEAYVGEAIDRMVRLIKEMRIALANGDLVSATKDPNDLEYSPNDRSLWNSEQLAFRFVECQFDPGNPLADKLPSAIEERLMARPPLLLPGNKWIFVRDDTLAPFLSRVHNASAVRGESITGPNRKSFETLFRNLVLSSPHMRTHTNDELKKMTGALPLSDREFNSARSTVLRDMEEGTRKVWTKGGRPKKSISH